MKEKIEQFIKNNKLTFERGRRNSDLTIICGYAQSLGEDSYEKLTSVLKPYFTKDGRKYLNEWRHFFNPKFSIRESSQCVTKIILVIIIRK